MRPAARVLMGCLLFCWGSMCCFIAPAQGAAMSRMAPPPAPVLIPPLSLAHLFAPLREPTAAQLEADRSSRTAFRHLHRAAAISLAERNFSIARPVWTPPVLQAGAKIERYIGANALVEQLPGGQHAVASSTIPLRVDSGSGPAPTSLTLRDVGEAYVPANPLVPVAISTHAAGGVSFPGDVSVVPMSSAGAEAPALVGNRVMFANAAHDTDFMAEPTPDGAQLSWQLRSAESPSDESLAFHLPSGASLRESTSLPGAVEMLQEGTPRLLVLPPLAQDANGDALPVSYKLDGDVLHTQVDLEGDLAFPVLVDPEVALLAGYYGTANSANVWSGWGACNSAGHCKPEPCNNNSGIEFCPLEFANLIQTGINPTGAAGAWGEWYVDTPGLQGRSGSAGITRVDLSAVTHRAQEQSWLIGEFVESNGEHPIYSWNGFEGLSGYLPLDELKNLTERPIAFCAQKGGGTDNNNKLCDEENNQAKDFLIADELTGLAQTEFNYIRVGGATVTYREPANPNKVVLYTPGYSGQWLKTGPTNWYVEAEDEGLGIAEVQIQIPLGNHYTAQESLCSWSANGFAGCPYWVSTASMNLSGIAQTGELHVAAVAKTPALRFNSTEKTLFLDQTPPTMGPLNGTLGQAADGVIGSGNYTLEFSAGDGSAENWPEHAQSGVRSLEVKVDGRTADTVNTSCPAPVGEPAGNCFSLSGSWTMNGQAFGAGVHTITVVAKDWVGNENSRSMTVTVNEAPSESVGPGAVNLETGAFELNTTDATISGGTAMLSVSRSYNSRNISQGASGPLGQQWQLNLPDRPADGQWQSLSPLPSGSVALRNAHGDELLFQRQGNGFTSPAGYQTDTLTEPSQNPVEYQLADAQGNYTRFTQISGGGAYYPTKVVQASGAGGLDKVSYSFRTKEGVTEPTQVLGPEPSPGACTAKLVQGCRALVFSYDEGESTATGEAESQWGEYKGRLSSVAFVGWEPVKGEMSGPIAVAQYQYDSKGRLRAEYDPRVSPALKTIYGYNAEGRVTAISPPGEEPWILHYGAIASDTSTGRLLSVARLKPETPLWNGKVLTNKKPPVLTSSVPVVGKQLSTSQGTWSSNVSRLAFSYQWERCTLNGTQGPGCLPIPGATNETYTPVVADAQHLLRVAVSAADSSGSLSVMSEYSGVVDDPAVYSSAFGSAGSEYAQMEKPSGIAVAPSGNVWVADRENARLEEFTASGGFIEAIGWGVAPGTSEFSSCSTVCKKGTPGNGHGQFNDPEGIAISPTTGTIYVTDANSSEIQEFNAQGQYMTSFAGGSGHELERATGIVVEPSGASLWVADTGKCRVEEFSASGSYENSYGECGSATLGSFEHLVGVAIAQTELTTTKPLTNLYALDAQIPRVVELRSELEWAEEFGKAGKGKMKANTPFGIAGDPFTKELAVTTNESIETFTPEGEFVEQFANKEPGQLSTPKGVAVNASTGAIYVADSGHNRIELWKPASTPVEEPVQPAPSPGGTAVTTIEYRVPMSGASAPQQMTTTEVERWGQKDLPVSATAIFPPSEPQGWPASTYTQATVFYQDSADRNVNIARPGGGIATSEYNPTNNNVERTLSPDNREAALKEPNSPAVAHLLSTEDAYNSEGTQLTSSKGPQHKVKLTNGEVVLARKHAQFFYDEGAPQGATYNLVTKTIEGAEVTGAQEKDTRTVTQSYSGQGGLGWQLHEPTSTKTSTGAEELTGNTVYEPSNGEVKEASSPTGSKTNQAMYLGQVASKGTGNGQLSSPAGVALDGKGDLWVADRGNARVEEFGPTGSYIKAFPVKGTLKYVSKPTGIAIGANSNVWVTNAGEDAVQEFNEKGELIREFGKPGAGNGEFNEPRGIVLDGHGHVLVADTGNQRVQTFTESGEFVKSFKMPAGTGGNTRPYGIALDLHGHIWTANNGASYPVTELSESGELLKTVGVGVQNLTETAAIAIDSHGEVWVEDPVSDGVLEFNEAGTYEGTFGTGGSGPGQFKFLNSYEGGGIATDANNDVWVSDTGNGRVQRWLAPVLPAGNTGAHTTQTFYYAYGTGATPGCSNHPEWVGLPCQRQPAAQPEDGLSNVPVTTYTYNIWDEAVATKEMIGSVERTTTLSYDAAGRTQTSTITSNASGVLSLPSVSDEYSSTTGALVKQHTTSEGTTRTISSTFNTLGQLVSYTDADSSVTKYEYETEKDFRLLKTSSDEGGPAAATDTYSYSSPTGDLASVKDSAAGIFTAVRDVEGNIVGEGYPDGVNAEYTLNPIGERVGLTYTKPAGCASNCTLYSDSVTPSIHGQWLSQVSSLSSENYTYDGMGRLTEAQETVAGNCTARLYNYDEDGNRTSVVTRAPGSEGKCATEGGTAQSFAYDTADRLDEGGVSYDPMGNTATLPAADAGGALTSSYYVNDTLASQEQGGQSISYQLDPAGRVRLTTTAKGASSSSVVSHYCGAEETPAWSIEETSGAWMRNITGVTGALVAVQNSGKAPVLQIADLHGDIVGTVTVGEPEVKLALSSEASEFGVPRGNATLGFSWLGADQISTELSSGIVNMGARTYIPQLGRFEQTDPQPGGSVNAYAYTFDDPVNEADTSGAWTYDYSAAEPGEPAPGTPRSGLEPGAVVPAPADLQAEAVYPWELEGEEEEEEEGEGGDPVAVIAVRANTPEARFAEAQCDKAREELESHGHDNIGNFSGKYQTEPGGRYKGTSYEMLYVYEPIFLPLGMGKAAANNPPFRQESTCHVIVETIKGKHYVTHKAHFRIGQGLRGQNEA